MKKLIVLLLLLLPLLAQSQSKLKKKYRQNYTGTITAYEIKLGDTIRQVSPSKIRVQLTKDSLFLNIDRSTYSSSFQVSNFEKDKKYLKLEVKFAPNGFPETYILNKKTKTLIRKGIFPSPDVELLMEKN